MIKADWSGQTSNFLFKLPSLDDSQFQLFFQFWDFFTEFLGMLEPRAML